MQQPGNIKKAQRERKREGERERERERERLEILAAERRGERGLNKQP